MGLLVCRLTTQDTAAFEEHREFFTAAVAADASAFAALMRTAEPAEESVVAAAEVPLSIAERAARLVSDLSALAACCPPRFASDVETALGLAGAAIRGGACTASLNIESITTASVRKAMEIRLRAL